VFVEAASRGETMDQTATHDVLILGAGLAGLRAAVC